MSETQSAVPAEVPNQEPQQASNTLQPARPGIYRYFSNSSQKAPAAEEPTPTAPATEESTQEPQPAPSTLQVAKPGLSRYFSNSSQKSAPKEPEAAASEEPIPEPQQETSDAQTAKPGLISRYYKGSPKPASAPQEPEPPMPEKEPPQQPLHESSTAQTSKPGILSRYYTGSSKPAPAPHEPEPPMPEKEPLQQPLHESSTAQTSKPGILSRYYKGSSKPAPAVQEPESEPSMPENKPAEQSQAESSKAQATKPGIISRYYKNSSKPAPATAMPDSKPAVLPADQSSEPPKQENPQALRPGIMQRYFSSNPKKPAEVIQEPEPEPKIEPTLFPRIFTLTTLMTGSRGTSTSKGTSTAVSGPQGDLYFIAQHEWRRPRFVLHKGPHKRAPPLGCIIMHYPTNKNLCYITLDYFLPRPPKRCYRRQMNYEPRELAHALVREGNVSTAIHDLRLLHPSPFTFDFTIPNKSKSETFRWTPFGSLSKPGTFVVRSGNLTQVSTGEVIAKYETPVEEVRRDKWITCFTFCSDTSFGDEFEVLAVLSLFGCLEFQFQDSTFGRPTVVFASGGQAGAPATCGGG